MNGRKRNLKEGSLVIRARTSMLRVGQAENSWMVVGFCILLVCLLDLKSFGPAGKDETGVGK